MPTGWAGRTTHMHTYERVVAEPAMAPIPLFPNDRTIINIHTYIAMWEAISDRTSSVVVRLVVKMYVTLTESNAERHTESSLLTTSRHCDFRPQSDEQLFH